MALAQDILTRIVRIVRSRGAVFVVTTKGAVQYCIKVRGSGTAPTIQPIALPEGPDDVGTITEGAGSSYKKINGVPTFLLCGNLDYVLPVGGTPFLISTSYVYISNNGIDWRFKFTAPFYVDTDAFGTARPSESRGTAFVWSGNALHYAFVVTRRGMAEVMDPEGDMQPWKQEYIYHSANGESWSGSAMGQTYDEHLGYRSPFPPAHCTHHNSFDPIGQNVPDGYMDALRAVTMRPKQPPLFEYSVGVIGEQENTFLPWTPSPVVQVTTADGTVERTVPGFSAVYCVAGANNIWMAGGIRTDEAGAALALSFNNGATWTAVTFSDDDPVLSISAAPMTDIPGA